MNLQNLIGGMSAAQYGGQVAADEASTAERQVRELERMRAQDALSARTEQYRQELMRPVEGPEALPSGAPAGMSVPKEIGGTAAASAAPTRQTPTGPSPFLSPTAPNQSTAESARLARAGRAPSPTTAAQAQGIRDRAAMMTIPSALADVAQAPAAVGLNAFGAGVAGAQNLAGRVVNAFTGEQTLPTDKAYRSFGMTPFTDANVSAPLQALETKNMTPEQRFAELQRMNAQAQPQAAASQQAAPAANAPRGIRNNNPGNLIYNSFTAGLGATGKDAGGFAIFPSMDVGQAAAISNLEDYGKKGLNTIEKIVGTWAPAAVPGVKYAKPELMNTPEQTRNYTNFVAQQLGVAPGAPLNMQDPQVLQRIAAAKFQFENGRPVAMGQAAAPSAPAVPGQQPAAQPAASPQEAIARLEFTPDQITKLSSMAQQESRMAQMRLQDINRMLQVAPDVDTATKLRDEASKIRFGGFTAQLVDASAQAIGGNPQALAQLANAAKVQYAQTAQGFVEVTPDPATGQYRAVSKPMPLNTFVNSLFSVATGAAAQQEAKRNEAALKIQGEIAVEQVKGLNKMREVSATAEKDLQKLLFERKLSMNDVAKVDTVGGPGKEQILVTTKGGQVAIFQPAQDMGRGVMSQPSLQPIQ